MTWLISKALMQAYTNSHYLQEPGVEYSAENCSDGEPSAQSSGESIPQAYCAPDKMTAFSRLSRFGMTCKPLTESRGADLLTWYLGGFPARTSALPEKVQELPGSGQECGTTWHGSLARFDLDSLSWKTAQLSLLGDSELSSVIWPRSGMTAGGECWELPMLGRTTKGIGSGLWPIPTPTCNPEAPNHGSNSNGTHNLVEVAKTGWSPGMKWPTPCTRDHHAQGPNAKANGHMLQLSTLVEKMWPAPTGNDSKNSTLPESQRERDGLAGSLLRMGESTGGQLNPMWVEWLMGWPLGWTDLKPLGTDRCLSVLQPLGKCLEA